jgi:Glutathione peroxidase
MAVTEDAYRFEFTSIDGDSLPFEAWRGRPVLVVNTASFCGYTPQYSDLQADQVERWPIDRLIPYAKNSRTHSEAQIAQLAASMKEWGWTNPVLAGEAGGVRMIFCSCVIS